ncbi:MAG: hypothetical protein GX442_17365 [Candidatus Riflebacteria bacterium]|nr:hypothetical protein [Candidatus Riflebacteria bacterium]
MERKLPVFLVLVTLLIAGGMVSPPVQAQISDADGLALDIPEPPGARQELPSPIPMIYEFVGGLMGGDQDRCLLNFDVATFLALTFGAPLKRLNPSEYQELYAYQVQVQRNEFRFLSRIMHRMAKDARFNYSNPRFHNNVQSKVVVNMKTTKGNHSLELYARYVNDRWAIYDYILDGKRFTQGFKEGLGSLKLDGYIASLRPFYDEFSGTRQVKNDEYGISLKVPSRFQLKEKLGPNLLASVSGLDGQFLVHVQAAQYSAPQTLTQVATEIKETILPFKPRLYDQWKTDIAGVDIGNVLFQFEKNGKLLFTHMVIIPMGAKLVVLNFYHSTLQLMKHLTNVREKMLDSLNLTKIEANAGELSLPGDDLGLPASPGTGEIPAEPPSDDGFPQAPPPPTAPEIPPPGPGEEPGMLDPDAGPPPPPPDEGAEEPPPPPPDEGTEEPPPPPPDMGSEEPPPPPDEGGDLPPPDAGGGSDVSF